MIKELLADPLAVKGELKLLALCVDEYQTLITYWSRQRLQDMAYQYSYHELISKTDYDILKDYICETTRVNYSPNVKQRGA